MIKNPKITVLMPVYNAESYLREAIDSIFNQSFTNFEFLIINDASTDSSKNIILSYKDPRIRYFENKKNLGVARTLNKGLRLAKGKYIARMDADDISFPTRLEKQVEFMDKHPGIAVCGTWLKAIFDTKSEIWKVPDDFETIRCLMLFHSVIYHPTVIIRTEIIKKYNFQYKTTYPYAEDYELWLRIAKNSLLANLPEVLLHRRIRENKHIDNYLKVQARSADKIRLSQIQQLGIRPSKYELAIHMAISVGTYKQEKLFVNAAEKWLLRLVMANFKTNKYPHKTFVRVIVNTWFSLHTRRRYAL